MRHGWVGALLASGLLVSLVAAQPPEATRLDRRSLRVTPGLLATAVRPEVPLRMVRRDAADKRLILGGDPAAGSTRVLYTGRLDLVRDLAISPDRRYTAALETRRGRVVDGEYVELPRSELVVLDAAGQVVRRIEQDVQRYAFSPDGTRIAYLVGAYYEGGVGFEPRGVFVLGVASGAVEAVAADDVYDVEWSEEPGRPELRLRALAAEPSRRVLRFDLARKELSTSPHAAFHVSPDGRFALKRGFELMEEGRCGEAAEEECFEVLELGSGRALPRPQATLGKPLAWAPGGGHVLLLTTEGARLEQETRQLGQLSFRAALRAELVEAETVLWDVGAGRVIQTTKALPMPARDLGTWVASPSDVLRLEVPVGQQLRLDRRLPAQELQRIRIRLEPPPR